MQEIQKTEKILVKPAELDDVKSLSEIYMRVVKTGHSLSPALQELFQKTYSDNKINELKNLNETEMKTILAINSQDIIVGALEYYFDLQGNIYIQEEWVEQKGKNVGNALIGYVKAEAKQADSEYIYTDACHESLEFFKKMGFVRDNVTDNAMVNRLHYQLKLSLT